MSRFNDMYGWLYNRYLRELYLQYTVCFLSTMARTMFLPQQVTRFQTSGTRGFMNVHGIQKHSVIARSSSISPSGDSRSGNTMAAWAYGKIGQWLAQRQRLMRVERLCTTTFFLCKVQTLPFLLGQISNMFLIKVKALL